MSAMVLFTDLFLFFFIALSSEATKPLLDSRASPLEQSHTPYSSIVCSHAARRAFRFRAMYPHFGATLSMLLPLVVSLAHIAIYIQVDALKITQGRESNHDPLSCGAQK